MVRIDPKVQDALALVKPGSYTPRDVPPATVYAMSTLLHETIHWWQHVGTTAGLILSSSYPAQLHRNYKWLKKIIASIGKVKSLRKFHKTRGLTQTADIQRDLNFVLNNWHDIEFCHRFMLGPSNAKAMLQDPYFNSLGHSYHFTWATCVQLIAQIGDPNYKCIPDPRTWEDGFQDVQKRKVEGFYLGSPVRLSPFGVHSVFEGQARFSQLQYLHFASGRALEWDDFESQGLLGETYTEAFSSFLKILGESWPKSVDHPLVAMFLLLCDLAANPTEGFPFPIRYFDTFLTDVDPGLRFLWLTTQLKSRKTLLTSIAGYTRDEYYEVTETLTKSLMWPSQRDAIAAVAGWPLKTPEFDKLLSEEATFAFDSYNLPIRVFLARFIRYHQDKLEHPQFFVWPGAWFWERDPSTLTLANAYALFERNSALFVDSPEGDVRPQLFEGKPHENIYKMFHEFFGANAVYCLSRQWQIEDGPFETGFDWLPKKHSTAEMWSWASAQFNHAFGVGLDGFDIL